MPTGSQEYIDSIGSAKVVSNITLNDVFHMLKFKVNLLSVSQLTYALEYIMIFFQIFMSYMMNV